MQIRKNSDGTQLPRYTTNPWLEQLLQTAKTTKRIITSPINKNQVAVLCNRDTGEPEGYMNDTGFFRRHRVESNQFVKVYAAGIAQMMGLSKAGAKVFQFLFNVVSDAKNKNKTLVQLKYEDMISDEQYNSARNKPVSRGTFYKGITELINREFIAQFDAPCWYFVNPLYMFNGNRLIIVDEYVREDNVHHLFNVKNVE